MKLSKFISILVTLLPIVISQFNLPYICVLVNDLPTNITCTIEGYVPSSISASRTVPLTTCCSSPSYCSLKIKTSRECRIGFAVEGQSTSQICSSTENTTVTNCEQITALNITVPSNILGIYYQIQAECQ